MNNIDWFLPVAFSGSSRISIATNSGRPNAANIFSCCSVDDVTDVEEDVVVTPVQVVE